MTDREKLIELLCEDPCTAMSTDDCETCELRYKANCYSICMADHLLANGVTFAKDTDVSSKWISVEERLPSRDDTVLAFWEGMRGTDAAIQVNKGWNIYGTITHWMPLPQPPREE